MALRFRRTVKIAPGIRLNLTKTGVSARVGPRGLGVTVGTSGTTVSAGLPGTGLHVSQKLPRGPKSVARPSGHQGDASVEGLSATPARTGSAVWTVVIGLAVVVAAIWFIL